jgi:hypothetical protein
MVKGFVILKEDSAKIICQKCLDPKENFSAAKLADPTTCDICGQWIGSTPKQEKPTNPGFKAVRV